MADKSKMKCNVPTRSDRAGKKKMVKACANGKEKLIHFGAKGYGHNYLLLRVNLLKLAINVERLRTSLRLVTGRVKTMGRQGRFY